MTRRVPISAQQAGPLLTLNLGMPALTALVCLLLARDVAREFVAGMTEQNTDAVTIVSNSGGSTMRTSVKTQNNTSRPAPHSFAQRWRTPSPRC